MSDIAGPLPGHGKRRSGAITFWIGIVIVLGSLALAIITGIASYNSIANAVSDATPIDGSKSITLEAGEERTIYQVEQGDEQAVCTVTGPGGQELSLSRNSTIEGTSGDTSYVNVGNFTAESAGEHEIACEGPRTLVGPSLDVATTIGGIFAVLAGIGGMIVGGILVIIGAILWFLGRGERKRALEAGSGGYGYGQGGYQQGGYQQDGYQGGPPPPPPPPSQ